MRSNPHVSIVRGVSTGSWLPKPRLELKRHRSRGRPAFMSPLPALIIRTAAEDALSTGPPRSNSNTKIVLALLAIVMAIALSTLVLMEAMGAINWIPPTWSPPPSLPPSPSPPGMPPHPPIPPTPPLPPLPPASPPLPPHPTLVIALSTCLHVLGGQIVILVNNGRCEDGGAFSVASICELGTDYPDCPVRGAPS